MLHCLRPKLTYANVVASLALFIALGGSAYAIGAGTIGSREIRDNSIRSRDVRNNALTGRDISERTLRSAPNVYHRTKVTPITLTPGGAQDSISCNPGDTAIFGKEGAGANPLSYRTGGNLRNKSTYTGIVYGEPAAAGQRTNLDPDDRLSCPSETIGRCPFATSPPSPPPPRRPAPCSAP